MIVKPMFFVYREFSAALRYFLDARKIGTASGRRAPSGLRTKRWWKLPRILRSAAARALAIDGFGIREGFAE
jgi:hypothetical protein